MWTLIDEFSLRNNKVSSAAPFNMPILVACSMLVSITTLTTRRYRLVCVQARYY